MSSQLEYARAPYSGLARRERRGSGPWISLGISVLTWVIPFAVPVVVLCLIIGIYGVYLAPLFLAIIVYLQYCTVMNARRRNGDIIVGYVDLAVRLNLPLVSFLSAAARSETGRRARQLADVRANLATGSTLAEALSDATDVPDHVIARVHSAESLGQVRSALKSTVEENDRAAAEADDVPDATLYRIYVLFMLFSMSALTLFMLFKVVPKFKEIFKDYKTTLPRLTEFIIQTSSFLTDDIGIVTLLVLLAFAGFLLVITSYWVSRILLPSLALPKFRRLWDWCAWRLPLFHTLEHDRAMTEICALFAAATGVGASLPVAAQRAMNLSINGAVRDQLDVFHKRLLAGDTPAGAAGAAGLPQLLAGLLAPTSAHAPEPELFTFLERYYRNRFSRLQLSLRGVLGPALVIAFGLVEGTIVVAMFLPLIKLIASVSGPDAGGSL